MRYSCVIFLTVVTLIIGGCERRDGQLNVDQRDTVVTAPSDRASEENVSGALTDTTSEALEDDVWTTDVRIERPDVREIAQVVDVRLDEHAAFDRLAVEFDSDSSPGFQIGYVGGDATECGSGRAIDPAGDAVLEIRIEPARGHTDDGQSSVADRQRELALGVLSDFYVSCDFEAVFTIVLGTDARRPFRVFRLDDPDRLVVDVRKAVE